MHVAGAQNAGCAAPLALGQGMRPRVSLGHTLAKECKARERTCIARDLVQNGLFSPIPPFIKCDLVAETPRIHARGLCGMRVHGRGFLAPRTLRQSPCSLLPIRAGGRIDRLGEQGGAGTAYRYANRVSGCRNPGHFSGRGRQANRCPLDTPVSTSTRATSLILTSRHRTM